MSNSATPKSSSDRITRAFKEHEKFFMPYLNRAVKSVDVTGLEHFDAVADGRVMVVCPHRSHMDYVAGGLRLSSLGVTRLRFAAGDNLTRIPWFGAKIRAMGAFSVFRGKASQRSYLFRLTEQVRDILLNNYKVVVYPEGGRSYSGEMLDIRTGITGAAVMAQQSSPQTPVYYLPMTMAYDYLPEVPYYSLLLRGKRMRDKGSNSVVRFMGSFLYYWADGWSFFKLLFNKHPDHIKIILGEPVKITDIVDVEGEYQANARNEFLANRKAIQKCADYIKTVFVDMFAILPHHLVASLLMADEEITPEHVIALRETLVPQKGNLQYIENLTGAELVAQGKSTLKRHRAITYSKKKITIKSRPIVQYFSSAVNDLIEREL